MPSLESLLLPGTPASVRGRYLSLAKRAQTTSFDLLEDDIVVLDTETTGLSFRDCELIEIAAARLSGREVTERFQTFVRPKGPIPPEIQSLTHITQLDVSKAPCARDAVAALSDFVGGMPVLAHNATFDRTFVEMVPGGAGVSDTWIDTLSLSRMALPCLSTHRLSDMASAFGCDSVTHRATDDVDALCGMWRVILLGLSDLPPAVLLGLSEMHEEVDWPLRPIFAHLASQASPQVAPLKQIRHELVSECAARPRTDFAERAAAAEVPSFEEIRRAFASDGMVAGMYEHFECRPDQLQMAEEVRKALEGSSHRSIEAGTGVGKSVAYLLPELLYAKLNNLTVGVATKTNALTDQLVSHELPALDGVIPGGVSFTSLKGYDHYLCLHRMDRALTSELPLSEANGTGKSLHTVEVDMLNALAVGYAAAAQIPEGDLDALGIRWRNVPRSLLTTTPAECLHGRCPYYPNECLVHGARKRAAASDVVVTNHSLLLRNVDMEGKILPPIRHWVVDEAHAFEEEARRQWAREVSGERSRHAFELLGGMKSGAIHNAMLQLGPLEGGALHARLLTKASASLSRASLSVGDFFLAVHGLSRLVRGAGDYDNQTLWIDSKVRGSELWLRVADAGAVAMEHLDEAIRFLREAAGSIAEEAPQLGTDLLEAGRFLPELLENLRLIVAGEDDSYVYSALLSRRERDRGRERLLAEKIDVGADLGRRWLPEMESVVFTSATIAVGDSFDHFNHAVGLDLPESGTHKDVRLTSSFDFERNMSVVVAQDMPQPSDPRYLAALESLLYDVHRSMGGSVLTLFTNRRDMELAYDKLQPQLAQQGLKLIYQERRSSPRRLREKFMADESCSLFALRSFWEGFDAAGDALRCVVVPKLPFASPHDPLVCERELREERSWWRHSLPEAVISLKQAAGRLIRSSSDAGVLVLADSRLVSKRYGAQFLRSLPNPHATKLSCSQVGRYLELWRSSRA